jgi:hypothetical protein
MKNSTKHWVFRGWKKLQNHQQISSVECEALIGFFSNINRVLEQIGVPDHWTKEEQEIARRVYQSFFYVLYRSQAEQTPEQPLLHMQEIPRVLELAEQIREFQLHLSHWESDPRGREIIDSLSQAVEVLITAAIRSFTLQEQVMKTLTHHLSTAGLYELAQLYLGENVDGEAIRRWMNQKKRAWLRALQKQELSWIAKQSLRDQLDVELSNWLYHRLFYSTKGDRKGSMNRNHIENYKKITSYYKSIIDFFIRLDHRLQKRGYSPKLIGRKQWVLLVKKPLYYLFWHQARRNLYPALRKRIDRRQTTADDQFLLILIKMVYDGKLTTDERRQMLVKIRRALACESRELISIEGQQQLALVELLRESQTMWIRLELDEVSLILEQKKLYKELLSLKRTYVPAASSIYLPFSWLSFVEEALAHLDEHRQKKFQEIAKPLTHKVVNIKKDGRD